MDINKKSKAYELVYFITSHEPMPKTSCGFYFALAMALLFFITVGVAVVVVGILPFITAGAFYYDILFNDSAWLVQSMDGFGTMIVFFWIWVVFLIFHFLTWFTSNHKNIWIVFVDNCRKSSIAKWFKKQHSKICKEITYIN